MSDIQERYRFEERVGQGGMGEVFRAIRVADGHELALKLSFSGSAEAAQRLLTEGALLAKVGPPAVPRVHEQGVLEDGRAFVAMEFIRAPTLKALIRQGGGPMPLPLALRRMLAILDAVDQVHAAGVVHRDLKPSNILFEDDHRARIIDFGIAAKDPRSRTDEEATTQAGAGSAHYMAPEQCSGSSPDQRADLYALGIILFELLTGMRPFDGPDSDVLQAHLSRRPSRPSALAPEVEVLDRVVLRCLEKVPADRYATCSELRDALVSAENAEPTRTRTAAPVEPVPAKRAAPARKLAALIFARFLTDPARIQSEAPAGTSVVHVGSGVGVLAVTSTVDAPVLMALQGASELVQRGLASHAVVDSAEVSTITARGRVLYASALFSRADRYPDGDDPPVQVTTAASTLIHDVPLVRREGHEGLWVVPEIDRSTRWGPSLLMDDRAVFVGRTALVEALLSQVRSAARGPPAFSVVEGGEGVGKTRLIHEVVRVLSEEGREPAVFAPRGPQTGRALIADLVKEAIGVSERPVDLGQSVLSPLFGTDHGPDAWAALALVLGWLAPASEIARRLSAVPGVLPNLQRAGLVAALTRRARARPLAVVVDNAQWADRVALEALVQVCRDDSCALWVCCATRAAEDLQDALRALPLPATISNVPPLEDEAAGALCRELLLPAENVPAEVIGRLVAATAGTPRLLIELVRGMKATGLVRQSARRQWIVATDELQNPPETPLLQWLAERELSALPEELGAHARLAALMGTDIDPLEVRGVLRELDAHGQAGAFPLDAGVSLRRLEERAVLARTGAGLYRFQTELLRESFARTANEALRLQVHRAALAFHLSEPPTDARLLRLAWHAGLAGDDREAAAAHLALADRGRGQHAYLEAERHYSGALRHVGGLSWRDEVRALRGRGLMRYRVGRHEDAVLDLTSAREKALAGGDTRLAGRILLDEAMALDWMNEYRRSKDRAEEAQTFLDAPRSFLEEAELQLALGRSHMRFSDFPEAIRLLEQAVATSTRVGDEAWETRVVSLLLLAPMLASTGRIEESERAFDEVTSLCESRGDRLHLATAIQNRVLVGLARNDPAQTIASCEGYLRMCRELGLLGGEFRAEYNLAEVDYQAGHVESARTHLLRAEELGRRLMGEGLRPDALLLQARIALFSDDEETARAAVARLHDDQSRAQREGNTEAVLLPAEQLLLKMVTLSLSGDTPDARWAELVASAEKLGVQSDPIEVAEAAARAAARAGRTADAHRWWAHTEALSARLPHIMQDRLRRTHAWLAQRLGAPELPARSGSANIRSSG